jgi:hypothetical protein
MCEQQHTDRYSVSGCCGKAWGKGGGCGRWVVMWCVCYSKVGTVFVSWSCTPVHVNWCTV